MLTYIFRRMMLMIPTLIGMTLLLFVVVRMAPGVASGAAFGSGVEMQGSADREEQVRKIRQRLGMVDQAGNPVPAWKQYFVWLGNTLEVRWKGPLPVPTGLNLGESMKYRKPVLDLIRERLPVTVTLNILATVIVYMIAIPGGMLSSWRRGKTFDNTWSFTTLALYSLPTIWIGSMAIGFLANPRYLGWFPSAGLHATDTSRMTFFEYQMDYALHLALPVLVMTYGGFAYLSKQMRASMLENLSLDYSRTARAKGLSEMVIMTRHVFRNSLLPLITIAAGIIPGLIGGSVIIETMFSIRGMGLLTYESTLMRDLPVTQGIGLVSAVLVLISYLVTDICYAIADPRVSYD